MNIGKKGPTTTNLKQKNIRKKVPTKKNLKPMNIGKKGSTKTNLKQMNIRKKGPTKPKKQPAWRVSEEAINAIKKAAKETGHKEGDILDWVMKNHKKIPKNMPPNPIYQ